MKPTCPKCGSDDVWRGGGEGRATVWHCQKCGKMWREK